MLQLRLWGFVPGSFMWQKPINHSCSLTGPLQHTRMHTNMHGHPHARGSAPAATNTEEHALLSPQTCPAVTPRTHARPSPQTIDSSILFVSQRLPPSLPTLIRAGKGLTGHQTCSGSSSAWQQEKEKQNHSITS